MHKIEPLIESLLTLADKADEIGEFKKADAISSVLSKSSLLKLAQYEGFQQYCILNTRAFQQAWKEKYLKSKKADPSGAETDEEKSSAQEAWLDVLAEYQEALLGNQEKFLESYASKSNFEHNDKVSRVFMDLVMEKISNSVHPGISILKTLDEMRDGRAVKAMLSEIRKTASSLLEKEQAKQVAEKTLVKLAKLEKEYVQGS